MKKLVLAGLVAASVLVGNVSAGDGKYIVKTNAVNKWGDFYITCVQDGSEQKIVTNGDGWAYGSYSVVRYPYSSAHEAATKACGG